MLGNIVTGGYSMDVSLAELLDALAAAMKRQQYYTLAGAAFDSPVLIFSPNPR